MDCEEFLTMVTMLLEIKIDTLSLSQKEAIVMFVSQLDREGNVISNPDSYLLAGALNILAEEDNSVSKFILGRMLKKTPKVFLEGSDFEMN
jgi:hypothetical protein